MSTMLKSETTLSAQTYWVLRLRQYSIRLNRRGTWVSLGFVLALLLVAAATLAFSRLNLSFADTWNALWGEGERSAVRSVRNRRLPRLLTACGVGGALAVAGALFQSLSRNPLGSPDVIGFTTGAATAATYQILHHGPGVLSTAVAALIGGILTALVVYLLARRGGVTGGLRLILVGIGCGAVLSAITDLMVVRADLMDATMVQQWTSGSLTGRGWPHVIAVFSVIAVLLPILSVIARRVSLMEMGDDTAQGLGIAVERYRFLTVILAVLLVGIATAAAGPIAFVALAAPQIARRLVNNAPIPIMASFFAGATLLAAADLLAQNLSIGLRTPVGLVTSLLGGLYLMWMLARKV